MPIAGVSLRVVTRISVVSFLILLESLLCFYPKEILATDGSFLWAKGAGGTSSNGVAAMASGQTDSSYFIAGKFKCCGY